MGQRHEKSEKSFQATIWKCVAIEKRCFDQESNDLHSVPCIHISFCVTYLNIPLIEDGIGWKVSGKIRQYASNCLAGRPPKILNVKANGKVQSDSSVHRSSDLEEMQQALQ